MTRTCSECGGCLGSFPRPQKTTCGDVCRKRRLRRLFAEARVLPDALEAIRVQLRTIETFLVVKQKAKRGDARLDHVQAVDEELNELAEALGIE